VNIPIMVPDAFRDLRPFTGARAIMLERGTGFMQSRLPQLSLRDQEGRQAGTTWRPFEGMRDARRARSAALA
jgi:hypothetical protein